MSFKKLLTPAAVAIGLALSAAPALAAKHYGPGVTDKEIKIGQTMSYSGPASAYGQIGKAEAAVKAEIDRHGAHRGEGIGHPY